jgi:hypothetical protein
MQCYQALPELWFAMVCYGYYGNTHSPMICYDQKPVLLMYFAHTEQKSESLSSAHWQVQMTLSWTSIICFTPVPKSQVLPTFPPPRLMITPTLFKGVPPTKSKHSYSLTTSSASARTGRESSSRAGALGLIVIIDHNIVL